MFNRPDDTYKISKSTLDGVLNDSAGPLCNIVEDIPEGSTVLDIGAGNGLLAMLFKYKKKNVVMDGVEPSKAAAKIAKKSYRNFYVGYFQEFLKDLRNNSYDYIVLADVVEHTQDPVAFLEDISKVMSKGTKVILSTPNVAFGSVRLSLLAGKFVYVDSGLLEKTHIRFFTKETLEQTVRGAGLGVEKIVYLQRRFDRTEIPISLKKNILNSLRLTKDELASTYQFYIILSKESKEYSFNNPQKKGDSLRVIDVLKSIIK